MNKISLNLADDVFQYFGLGCRSVSKLYVPKHFNFDLVFYRNVCLEKTLSIMQNMPITTITTKLFI